MPANTTQRAAKNSRKSIISTPFNTGRYDPRRLPWRMAGRIRYVTFEAPELFPIVSARILHAKDWGSAGGDLLRRDIRPRVSQTSAVFRGARRRLPRARSSVIHNRCAVSYPQPAGTGSVEIRAVRIAVPSPFTSGLSKRCWDICEPVAGGTDGSRPTLNGLGQSAISRSAAMAIGTVHDDTQPLAANSSWQSTPARVVGLIAAIRS
jgi:hypothetical protein